MLRTGPLTIDDSACFDDRVGAAGIARAVFDGFAEAGRRAIATVAGWHDDGTLPLLALPHRTDDLEALAPHAERLSKASDLIVLGTGGSSLGGATLYRLADRGFGNERGGPRVHFLDNIDPTTFDSLARAIDLPKAALIAISKSGGTAETLCQTFTLLERMGGGLADRVVAVSEPGARPLRALADSLGIPVLDHDPKVGGRFSVLSLTGMLPAMAAGIDARAVRRGAATVLDTALDADGLEDCAPLRGAAIAIGLARSKGVNQSVLMPYLDAADRLGKWYRQLWAESLGKEGHGTTPIDALGTVDQHSQLQLYLGGPRDKLFTVLMGAVAGTGDTVPASAVARAGEGVGYLVGRTMGDLLDAEQRATADTMIANGCPTRIIRIERYDEEALGALFMHFALETIFAAEFLGIDAFDQPAVEEGKVLARRYLGEMGNT